MMQKKAIWIDTDCGIDDAIAILLACQLNSVDIKGISSVAGNVEEYKTFKNSRDVANLANRNDIKVYSGAKQPLNKSLRNAAHVHGKNGLGDVEIEPSPADIQTENAFEMLYRAAKEAKGELEVVAVGPLTNIAITIANYPDIERYIKRLLIMGGAIDGGNQTPCAEFNIYADPHAAETVFKSNIPKVMFGLDVTLKSSLNISEFRSLKEKNSKVSKFFFDITESMKKFYEKSGHQNTICLHDACPVLFLEYPELFTGKMAGVYVETQGELTRGKTVSDLRTDFKFEKRDTLVMLDVNQKKFSETVETLLMNY